MPWKGKQNQKQFDWFIMGQPMYDVSYTMQLQLKEMDLSRFFWFKRVNCVENQDAEREQKSFFFLMHWTGVFPDKEDSNITVFFSPQHLRMNSKLAG